MIYFTSDTHYWHNNVIRYCARPHASVEEMNEDMVLKWNQTVKPEDTVYVLGDFSLAFRSVETFSSRLMGRKILIPGNHDFCHSYHKKSRTKENWIKWIEKYTEHGWTVASEQFPAVLSELGEVIMCHHPYEDDSNKGDKYQKWRPVDEGKLLLCGHIHEKWQTKKSPKGTLMINVGVDVHGFVPVSETQLLEIAKANGAR